MIAQLTQHYKTHKARIHRLSKEGGWIIMGQVASVLGALVLVRVLTEYLEPAEYGQLALGLTIAGLVNQVVMGGVIAGIGRFYSIATEKGDLWGYLRATRRLLLIATLAVIGLGMILIVGLAATGLYHWLFLALAALVFSIFTGYNSALNGIQNAARQRAIVALHGGMNAWLKIGLAVGFMLWFGTNSVAVVLGYALSAFIVTFSQLFFLRQLINRQGASCDHATNENWISQMWMFSWPMVAGGLFNWGYYASQRWALELFVSTAEVGKFYALTQIAYTPIVLAGSLFMSFMIPILYARVGDPGNHARVANVRLIIFRIAGIGLGAILLIAGIAVVTHDWVFQCLAAEKYRDVSVYMPLVIIAAGFLQVSLSLSSYISVQNKTRLFLWNNIFGNSIIAMLNLYLTWRYCLNGLIGGMVIGSIIHLSWMVYIVMKSAPINVHRN